MEPIHPPVDQSRQQQPNSHTDGNRHKPQPQAQKDQSQVKTTTRMIWVSVSPPVHIGRGHQPTQNGKPNIDPLHRISTRRPNFTAT
jgi:hypothetical protein